MRGSRSRMREETEPKAGHEDGREPFAAFEEDAPVARPAAARPHVTPVARTAPPPLFPALPSSGPGHWGVVLAALWASLALATPVAYWGVDAISRQDPTFFAALAALAIIPAFLIAVASTSARAVAITRSLVAQIAEARGAEGPTIDHSNEREAWRRTLAEAEDAALGVVDLIARERQAAAEAVEMLKAGVEAAAQTASRQVRIMREAARLMGEESQVMESALAETVSAMHDLSLRLRTDLETAESLSAKAAEIAARVDADSEAAAERIAEAAAGADAARALLQQAIADAGEAALVFETTAEARRVAEETPPRPARSSRARPSAKTHDRAPPMRADMESSDDLAHDLGLDWLVTQRPAAIEMLSTMGVSPADALDDQDIAAIARRARLGAAARRRAVMDCAPAAVARIERILERDVQVKRVAAAFHRDPGFDAGAPLEAWAAGDDVVRAYLLLDAALA